MEDYIKVVINECYGGFGLSDKAKNWLREKGITNKQIEDFEDRKDRHNKLLIECVQTLGKEANGWAANLKIREIYGNIYRIETYDGYESVVVPDSYNWITV